MKADAVGILLLIILLIGVLRLGIARMQASGCIIPIMEIAIVGLWIIGAVVLTLIATNLIIALKKDYEVSEWILVIALVVESIHMPISAIQYMKMLKKIDKRKDFL